MKTVFLWVIGALAVIIGASYFFTATDVATAPSRVVSETMKTGNIIANYESFYDLRSGYDSRVAQIKSLSEQLETETGSDRRYTQTDLNGAKQACRQQALRYNADSEKVNRSLFKSKGLPETLDVTVCEG